jgi:maltooligosyltrehalose trehalohydrolase
MTALLLLGPGTPMLFQGQEFGASSPFLFFADHHPELAKLVAKGRGDFLRQFDTMACTECDGYVAEPGAEKTFLRSKLDLTERDRHTAVYQLHRDLLQLRREDTVFSSPRPGGVDGAVLAAEAFVLRFFGPEGDDRLLLVNLGVDVEFRSLPEPLLAPGAKGDWALKWSSEDPRYGGCGTLAVQKGGAWRIPGHAAVVLAGSGSPP